MYASNYLETSIINLMRGTSLSAPSALYVALFLSDPTDTGAGGTEVSYNGYERQLITFSLDGSSTIQNSAAITFARAEASLSSPVTHIAIYDSQTGYDGSTHMWLYGALTTSLQIQSGVRPIFRAGAIKWAMNGNLSATYKQLILNTIRGQNSSVAAFTPYVGLCNGDPNSSGSELSGIDYARMSVTFDAPSSDDDPSTATITSNTAGISSPNPAGSYWGTWNYSGIYTAASGGSLFASVPLNSTYTMTEGSVAGFEAGALTFSVN